MRWSWRNIPGPLLHEIECPAFFSDHLAVRSGNAEPDEDLPAAETEGYLRSSDLGQQTSWKLEGCSSQQNP